MNFENIHIYNFENALRGMRNPKNSWDKSDSKFGFDSFKNFTDRVDDMISLYRKDELKAGINEEIYHQWLQDYAGDVGINFDEKSEIFEYAIIGPNDMKLAKTLIKGGPEHRKFLRQIFVSVDITAPLYWWKEADTYKTGTVSNSTSTMHKLTSKPITLDCFEIDDYNSEVMNEIETELNGASVKIIIDICESLRKKYIETKDKRYWKELVRWLPESWLQTRTITLNYENILSICHQRENHKLNEWSGKDYPELSNFIEFARSLPYASDFIFWNGLEN